MYFERLLARTGKANVREVFPNFSLFVYGGVNYAPYRSVTRRAYYEVLVKRALRRAPAVLTVSEYTRQELVEWAAGVVMGASLPVAPSLPMGQSWMPAASQCWGRMDSR